MLHKPASSSRTVKLGIIGLGPWSEKLAATIQSLPNVKLSAVAHAWRATKNVPTWVNTEKVLVYPYWEQLLYAKACDGVIIAGHPDTRLNIAKLALAMQTPMLLEKPVCTKVEDIERFASLAKWFERVPIVVDHTQLFNPAYLKLKSLVRKSGLIRHITSIGCNRGPVRSYSSLWDYGPHDASLYLDLTTLDWNRSLALSECWSQVDIRRARTQVARHGGVTYHVDMAVPNDSRSVWLKFGSGARVKQRKLKVWTDRDVFELNGVLGQLTQNGKPVKITDCRTPLQVLISDFAGQIRKVPDMVTVHRDLRMAVWVTRLLHRIERACLAPAQIHD